MAVTNGRTFAPLPEGDEIEAPGTPLQNLVAMLIAVAALLGVGFLAGSVIFGAIQAH